MKIEFKNVSKKYGKTLALDNFSVTLEDGVYGLLGTNGAGKTTLINILVGLLKNDFGQILINEKDVYNLGNDFIKEIGYLPQHTIFYRDFTVFSFMMYVCALKAIPKTESKQIVCDLLKEVSLLDAKDKKISALSGGMKQRLGIAQALIGNPKVLILDEPTAGLDPKERIRFRNLIAKFAKERIVLLATHIVSDIECIANKVILLKNGILIAHDTPENLENSINGKVFDVTIDGTQELEKYNNYKISNMQRNGNTLTLRIISQEKINTDAVLVKPNLEDVFLFYLDNEY